MIYRVDNLNNAYLAQAKAIHDRYEKGINIRHVTEEESTRYFMKIYKKMLPRGKYAKKLFTNI